MNPDSLCRVLGAIGLRKAERPELKQLYEKVLAWVTKKQAIL
jgi:hypothetical protein